jgi:Protein of unknown function (DUF3305)
MNPPSMPVSVWMEKRLLASRWAAHDWQVAAVTLADDAAAAAGSPDAWLRHDGHAVSLFRDEAEGYYLNTSSGSPMVFVMWRLEEGDDGEIARPKTVTLSYNEAARLMDAQEKVDAVPMPAALLPWLQAYVAERYKPEAKKKRPRASFLTPAERSRL